MNDIFSVRDQVVLVSGGTRGIGYAIAEGFAQRGATVVVTGRTSAGADEAAAKLQTGATKPPLGLACDVADAGQIKQLVKAVYDKLGRVDCLINVAGVNR